MKIALNKQIKGNTIKINCNEDIKKPSAPPAGYGQIPVDIIENDKEILIIAPIAGTNMDDAEIIVNNDVLTIRGERNADEMVGDFKNGNYYAQECFWGKFSRSVILPPNADTQNIQATQKNHILYIKIPKRLNIQMRIVKIKSKL